MNSRILDSIQTPADLHNLDDAQLVTLASEIRAEILATTSVTGGHVASPLGAVELTLAIHCLINSPEDKLLFDVGHQAYAHKLVTGRLNEFHTLRQHGGISGFPKPSESVHDVYASGHASDSLSIALGLAKARDLRGSHEKIVTVIGDASIAGGMAFEALNHIGQAQCPMTIILNDNEMSISKNVGALMRHLGMVRASSEYGHAKDMLQDKMDNSGGLVRGVLSFGKSWKESVKQFILPHSMIYENLGIVCTVPIDGHDIPLLREVIGGVIDADVPVLVHVVTKKGAGYEPAMKDPERFHGTGPFDVETGEAVSTNKSCVSSNECSGIETPSAHKNVSPNKCSSSEATSEHTNVATNKRFSSEVASSHAKENTNKCSNNESASVSVSDGANTCARATINQLAEQKPRKFTEVMGSALVREAEKDESIIAITASMMSGTGLKPFAQKFPNRCIDTGIAEEHAVGLAVGLATGGNKPVVCIYSTFLQRAYDQIIINVALQKLPVVFCLDRAGIIGPDGPTHHGVFDIAYLRSIPNMNVLAPACAEDLERGLHTALQMNAPVAIRYPKGEAIERFGVCGEVDACEVAGGVAGIQVAPSGAVTSVCSRTSKFDNATLEVGRARVLREGNGEGEDVVILAFGSMVSVALQVADKLAEDEYETHDFSIIASSEDAHSNGSCTTELDAELDTELASKLHATYSTRVVDMRWVKPLDEQAICASASAKLVVTLEDGVVSGGAGEGVLDVLSNASLTPKTLVLGVPDTFVLQGKISELRSDIGLDAETIAKKIRTKLAIS